MTRKSSDTLDPFSQGELEVQKIEREYETTHEQIEELEKKIKEYQSKILFAKEKGDPENLSNNLIRLARVNSALEGKASYAKYIARNADRAYRRLREQVKLDKISGGSPIGKAESEAYIDNKVDTAFKIFSEVQLMADNAEGLGFRTDTFMKMAQSGLSLIKNDVRGEYNG